MARTIVVLMLLLAATISSPAYATRYWVAPSGNDANSCTSIDGDNDPGVYRATPKGAMGCLSGGDTLTIKAGTYTGKTAVIASVPAGLSANAPTIVEGEPADTAGCALTSSCSVILRPAEDASLIKASHIIVRKLRLDNVHIKTKFPLQILGPLTNVLIEDVEAYGTQTNIGPASGSSASGFYASPSTSFVTFRRIHSHNNGNTQHHSNHGMYLQGDDTTVEDSIIAHNASVGIQCYSSHNTSDGRSDRCMVRRNIIRDNYDAGIAMEGHDGRVVNNLIENNGTAGVIFGYSGALRSAAYHNVIVNNGGTGIQIRSTASDSVARNNVVVGNSKAIDVLSGANNVVQSHNACSSGDSCGSTGKLSVAALTDIFVSATDFRLKSGSPAIDTGFTLAEVTTDFLGVPRPQGPKYDIGAYEYSVDTDQPPAAPTGLQID